jgi:hypothetical protein
MSRSLALAAMMLGALSGSAHLAAEPGSSRDLASLFGAERELAFEVSDYRDAEGKAWIRLSAAFESAYRADLEAVIATLWDFESAPKTFSRIEAVKVRSNTGTEAVIEQRTGIRVLGFAYLSNLVFRESMSRADPLAARIGFESIVVDGTTLSARGSWTLEGFDDASGGSTYVRYEMESLVAPAFPAQAQIMRRFGEADLRKVLRELGAAAARRIKRG